MKKYFFILLGIFTFFILLWNCKKQDSRVIVESFDINSAKEWWYGNFRKTSDYLAIDKTSPLTPPQNTSYKKYPGWRSAMGYKKFDLEIIEVPLFYATKKVILPELINNPYTSDASRISKASVNRLLLIKKNGTVIVRIVTIIPSVEYAKKTNYDLSRINFNSLPLDFNGYLCVSNWGMSLKRFVKVKNGKLVKSLNIVKKDELPKFQNVSSRANILICPDPIMVPNFVWVCAIVPTGDDVADQEHCEEIGHYAEEGGEFVYPDCYDNNESNLEESLENCFMSSSVEDCYCMLLNIGCSPGGIQENNPDDLCTMISEQAQSALESISSTIESDGISFIGEESGPDANGIIRKPVVVKKHHIIYTFPGGRTVKYSLFFPGVIFQTTTNSTWKWESLVYEKIARTEGGNPPCLSADVSASVSPITISTDKTYADFSAVVTATMQISCLGGWEIKTFYDNLSGTYYAYQFQ